MTYVDAMICPVKTGKRDEYIRFAAEMAAIFKAHGAQSVVECWGVDVPEGKVNSLHTAILREDDEAVVFSWIKWASKGERDSAWERIMADERMMADMNAAPFEGQRLIYGGFEMVVEA
mgnify:CR=1 FL=1